MKALLDKLAVCESSNELIAFVLLLQKRYNFEVGEAYIKGYVECFAEKIKTIYFDQGELPAKEMLLLASLVRKAEMHACHVESPFFKSVKTYFLNEYQHLLDNQTEKYIYNGLIFLADLFVTGYSSALQAYIERTIVFDTRKADIQNEWVRSFEYFLHETPPPLDTIQRSILTLLDKDVFFALPAPSQRAIFYWWLHVVWTHPLYINHPSWGQYFNSLAILSDGALEKNDMATQMYIHFFAYQILGNLFQSQEEFEQFNQVFNTPQARYFSQLQVDAFSPASHQKKKIVFVKDRIVENSPYKVECSLFTALMQDENFTQNYELYVLSMGYIDKAHDQPHEIERLKQLGIRVVSPGQEVHRMDEYYDHLTKALLIRAWFLENQIDIMVGCVNGYDIMNFLFATRTAPLQMYWSHGDFHYNVVGIDRRISHFIRPNPFNYQKFDVTILEAFLKPDEEKHRQEAAMIRQQWPDDFVILGSIGRLVKMDNDAYMSTLAEIMNQHKNTLYLACGTGNEESIKQKIVKYKIPQERFFFTGFINPHVYGYVIDIYLNTFPETGGESVNEFLSKGDNKYVVSLER